MYAGSKIIISNALTINTYLDYFSFPWLKYLVSAPSNGHEYLFQMMYKPNKKLEMYGRFREQMKQKDDKSSVVVRLEDQRQRNIRFNLVYNVSDAITLKSRIEYVSISSEYHPFQKGIVMIQDFQYNPKGKPFDFTFRYSLFQTDGYATRVYSYEANALYVFSIPAYYDQGSRLYAMLRITAWKIADIWIR